MSRKSVRWKREIARAQGNVDKVLPRHATGPGTYLMRADTAFRQGPHSRRGEDRICSQPVSKPGKEARIRGLAKKG